MKEKIKSYWSYCTLILFVLVNTACEDDDSGNISGTLTVNVPSIDLGDVEVGSMVQEEIIVTSLGLNELLAVTLEGEGLTVTRNTFVLQSSGGMDTVEVTFSPVEEGGARPFEGSVDFFAGGVRQSVPVSANVTSTPTLTVDPATIDFGEVAPGSIQSREFTLTGSRLTSGVTLSATGDGLTLDLNSIDEANGDNTITITFEPPEGTAEGPFNGSVNISDGGSAVATVSIVAEITEVFTGLPVGTLVYANDMEFGNDHEADAVVSDFEEADELHPTVAVAYTLIPNNDNPNRIRTNKTSSRCPDNSIGDCGNALRFTGNGSTVNIALSGLEAGRSYEVSYWVRPDGSSDRSMDVAVTGDTSDAFENWGGFSDRDFYREVVRTGVADGSGNLSINFEYSFDSTTRTISIDDLEVVTL
ncbi:MAG: choice-of-anchor D domain-containing protein [Bacteroidota bacterium]